MKKHAQLLVISALIILIFSNVVYAANWPNMSTWSGGSSKIDSGNGGGYVVNPEKSRTRYRLFVSGEEALVGGNYIAMVYEGYKDSNVKESWPYVSLGNTWKWVKKGRNNKYSGADNPKVDIGEKVFNAILENNGIEASSIMKRGKNDFAIIADIQFKYTDTYTKKGGGTGYRNQRFLSFKEVQNEGLGGPFSNGLWNIARYELGSGGVGADISRGTYYLPVIMHKELGTGKELVRTKDYNDFSAEPDFTLSTTTKGIEEDYNSLMKEGYNYAGVSVGNGENAKSYPDNTSTTISTDENNLFVTFWYTKKPVIVVEYVSKNTGRTIASDTYLDFKSGDKVTFNETDLQLKRYGKCYTYAKETQVDGVEKGNQPNVTIVSDDKSHRIVFRYEQIVKIQVHGVCKKTKESTTFGDTESRTIPYSGNYKAPKWSGYKFSQLYAVDYTKLSYNFNDIKLVRKKGEEVKLEVKEELKEDGTPLVQISVIFYYEPECCLTIMHVRESDNKELIDPEYIAMFSGKSIEKSPMSSYEDDSGIVYVFSQKAKLDDDNLQMNDANNSVRVDYNGKERTLIFYYREQKLDVEHKYVNGTTIEDGEEYNLSPDGITISKKDEYGIYIKNELNGKEDTNEKVKVGYNPDIPGDQKLIFYYAKPEIVFGNDPENPDPDNNGKVAKYETGIIPNNLNNQLINKKTGEKYWVLNQNQSTLYIKFALRPVEANPNPTYNCEVKFDFDVYINGEYKKGSTDTTTVTCNLKESQDGFNIYEGELTNIYVPVWVTEGKHKIEASTDYSYTLNGVKTTIEGKATANVTVVGAVYDFTITNLDGSDTTGDSMWKKSLFPTVKQVEEGYKAIATAIGQGTQQPSKYYQAIKRGTRFYFSLNTLGAANKKIEIVPSFYYVSANGGDLIPVEMTSNYKENERSISLTDKNRETKEFLSERAKKKNVTGTLFKIGDYKTIKLDRNVSTPYLGIKNDIQAKFNNKDIGTILKEASKSEENLYDLANHWYGDYSVPNDATFSVNGKQVDENGYLIVYFSIITRNENEEKYLAYNLASPFVQKESISEWKFERKGNKLDNAAKYTLKLPQTSVNGSQLETGDIWIKNEKSTEGHTAVIIYSLKPNVSTKQNVTSAGTH